MPRLPSSAGLKAARGRIRSAIRETCRARPAAEPADDLGGGHDLPCVPLGVLGGMKQQSPDRRRQTRPPDAARLVQRLHAGRQDLMQRPLDGVARRSQQNRRLIVRQSGAFLSVERRPLHIAEALASCVGQQPIETAREMLQVKSNRGRTAGPRPELFKGQRPNRPRRLPREPGGANEQLASAQEEIPRPGRAATLRATKDASPRRPWRGRRRASGRARPPQHVVRT